jgi:hypothetical protein
MGTANITAFLIRLTLLLALAIGLTMRLAIRSVGYLRALSRSKQPEKVNEVPLWPTEVNGRLEDREYEIFDSKTIMDDWECPPRQQD